MSLPEHQLVKKEPLLWRVVEKELANALLAQQSVESNKPPGVRGSGFALHRGRGRLCRIGQKIENASS
jgi:hypothetical protein